MRRAPLRRRMPIRAATPLARRTPLARSAVAAASAAQRVAIRGWPCIVCGRRTAIDPAHLVPRSLGGCDHALCVVALCRHHHRAYDRGALDFVPYLEPRFRAQAAHAVAHLGLAGAVLRLSGGRNARADQP
jgi:hypothetical protein